MRAEILNLHLKGALLHSLEVYAGWDKATISAPAPPLHVALVSLMALILSDTGLETIELGILLAFHGLLLINELLKLTWGDVLLPGDVRIPSTGARSSVWLLIHAAKTGTRQFAPLTDPTLLRLLSTHRCSVRVEELLVPLSAAQFRCCFHYALSEAGCEGRGFCATLFTSWGGGQHICVQQEQPLRQYSVLGAGRAGPHAIDMYKLDGACCRLPFSRRILLRG